MANLLVKHVETQGDRPVVVDDRSTRTWSELNDRVNQLIHALRAGGLTDGATIAVMSGNRCELFETYLAAGHANWVVVPVNWHWVSDELAYVLENSGAQVLIVEDQFREVAEQARQDSRTSRCVRWIVVGEPAEGFESYDAVLGAAPHHEPDGQGTGGPMFYTSGTTGFPKGVRSALCKTGLTTEITELISGSFLNMLQVPGAGGVTLLVGPAYHSAQWVFSMFPLVNGSLLVMRHKFDAEETLALIQQWNVTNLHLVPTQFIRLLALDEQTRSRASTATLTAVYHGAAPCPHRVKQSMLDWFGPVVHEYYGGTEGGFLTLMPGSEWPDRPQSLGQPTDLVELRIVDDDANEVPTGVAGQIYFRSRVGSDFEYHNDPNKTRSAHLGEGWATLGDVGYLDEQGYLFLSDRKIDMIISGGVNIYPAEIEAVLCDHPLVADAAVFGIPHEEMGEQVKAAVELVHSAPPDEHEHLAEMLIAHCREHLAGYKAPRSLDIVEALPRQETGKLYKRLLRDPYWHEAGRSI